MACTTTQSAQSTPTTPAHLPTPDEGWTESAKRALFRALESNHTVTADDLDSSFYGLQPPRHPSQIGGLFRVFYNRGLIRPVGYAISKRPSRRGGIQRVWAATAKFHAQLQAEQAATVATEEAAA